MSFAKRLFGYASNTSQVGTRNESNRQQWVRTKLTEIQGGLRLLDAGAGEQQYKKYCSHLTYVSQDFAQYDGCGDSAGLQMGKWDNSNLDIVSDITNIPEPDASFDIILCTEVLEHLPNPVIAISEFSRLLKKGGQLLITAPFSSLTHFAPYHFYTGFNRYFYEEHLSACGLEILEIRENGNYFEYIAQEVRRIPSVSQQYIKIRTTLFERLAMKVVLKMLHRFSQLDDRSSELLNFGFHVHAIKK